MVIFTQTELALCDSILEKSYSFWPHPCEFIDQAAMVLLLTKVTNEPEVRSETSH